MKALRFLTGASCPGARFPFAAFALTRGGRFACLLTALLAGGNARAQVEVPLWKNGAPGFRHAHSEAVEDRSQEPGRPDRWISYVSNPTLTIYPASGAGTPHPAVLVIPGGGFRYVCLDQEGTEVAQWLNSIGITAAVFKYRVLDPAAERTAQSIEPLFADTERAMRVLRQGAAGWKIDPKRIGVMGFSAGGTMAIRLVADADEGNAAAADPAERVSSRPDFVALAYSGIPGTKLPKATPATPPFFIVHAADDSKAPIEVAEKIFQYVTEGGGTAELHIFRRGEHGFGVRPKTAVKSWTTLYADWMRDLGLLAE